VLIQIDENSATLTPFGSLAPQGTPANARTGDGNSWAKLRHHEAAQAFWLAVAGVTTIALIANLILLILY
jgi:hypothetical protein